MAFSQSNWQERLPRPLYRAASIANHYRHVAQSLLPDAVARPDGSDVPSALTKAEYDCLVDLCPGGSVIEIGSWLGRSTIALAKRAELVHTIDWHRGDSHAGNHPTLLAFWRHIRRHQLLDKVVVHVARSEQICPLFTKKSFDAAFIDGFHTKEAVLADAKMVIPLVRDGGQVAFHDYGRHHFGVSEALEALGGPERLVDTIAVIRVTPALRRRAAALVL